ncbi:response regulator [Aquabacterium lacunae]|uniref:Sensory/regulatory protein RpfC n=1 Tax=Aquabacterium lacunae TaxID=2528630 RepID=A0A4Q9H681_9BURK|nr:CHASE domain-containing protein [Aquabacterium lacunae]TBO34337.1 response regulator [Aquabacterium lacunae]
MTPHQPAAPHSIHPARWALGVWFVGLLAAMAMGMRAEVANDQRRQEQFAVLTEQAVQDVSVRMQRYEYGLRGARGVVVGADVSAINRQRFEAYSRTREIDREFPGARGFGYIRKIRPAQVDTFLRTARLEGPADFSIRQFKPHNGDLFVIHYIEPLSRNSEAMGLDLASEPIRKATALRAMHTGLPTMSGPITLVQASGARSRGLLLMLPVYRLGTQPHTPAEREAATEGWTYAPLLIDEVIGNPALMDRHYVLTLQDRSDDEAVRFFQSARAEAMSLAARPEQQVGTRTLDVFGRQWQLDVRSTPEFEHDLGLTPAYVPGAITAVLFTLLSGLVYALFAHWAQLGRLGEQQARLAAMAASANDALIGLDHAGLINEWNDAATRMLGYPRDSALGQPLVRLLAPQYLRPLAEQHMTQAMDGHRVPPTDFVCLHLDGTLLDVSITLAPITDAPGKVMGCALTIRDITPQKQAAERILALNATLEQQVIERTAQAEAANQAKSAFLATMSHEIRTPMNALNGMAYLLGKSELDDRQKQYIDTLQDACKDLLRIVDNVLDLSKIEAGQINLNPQRCQIGQLVGEVVRLFEPTAHSKGLQLLHRVTDPQAHDLLIDGGRLKQMLSNLVGNAVKFTASGLVEVDASVQSIDGRRVNLLLQVKDTGIGMNDEVLKRLFQPYQQAQHEEPQQFGGTGLGLSIVKTLAEHMGGQVGVRSQAGQGSEFWISLPCELAQGDAQRPASRTGSSALPELQGDSRLAGVRVMVIDDSEVNALIARQILQFEQADVRMETDARNAVDWLIKHPHEIDVVLMDVQMPELDGRQATQLLRHHHPDKTLPVIALSAGVTEPERQQAMAAGMNDFIAKPFDAVVLVGAVAHWSRRATPSMDRHQGAWNATLPSSTPWPELPGVDLPAVQARFGRQVDLYATMMHRMLAEFGGEQLPDTCPPEAELVDHLRARLHKLKGIAGNLGVMRVHAQAEAAERAAKEQQHEALSQRLVALRVALADVSERVFSRLSDAPAPAAPAMAATRMSDQQLRRWLEQVKARDLDALQQWPHARACLQDQLDASTLLSIDSALQRLDFAQAQAFLRDVRWTQPSP